MEDRAVLLKEYELLTAHFFYENNRSMAKLNLYLTLNTALATVVGYGVVNGYPESMIVLLALLGLLANVLIAHLIARGRMYMTIRIGRAKEVEDQLWDTEHDAAMMYSAFGQAEQAYKMKSRWRWWFGNSGHAVQHSHAIARVDSRDGLVIRNRHASSRVNAPLQAGCKSEVATSSCNAHGPFFRLN